MARAVNEEGESCIDLLERAVHLLRSVSLPALLSYYAGSIPFVVAVLYFIADMSANPFAGNHCAAAAFGLVFLYVWMRSWHTLFCRHLMNEVEPVEPSRQTVRSFLRTAAFHMIYSTWSLILLCISMGIVFPFAWVLAYVNNLCIVGPTDESFKDAAVKARSATWPWPLQNHYAISIIGLLGMVVLLNLFLLLAQGPGLLKSFVGIETPFAQSRYWMMNSTFICIVFALVHLLVDPLFKALYVLRYCSATGRASGRDILAELRRLPPRRSMAGVRSGALVLFLLCSIPAAFGKEGVSPAPIGPSVEQLNETVDRVMAEREFTWRMPRDFMEEEETLGFFERFVRSITDWVEDSMRSVGRALERFFEWLFRLDRNKPRPRSHSSNFGEFFSAGLFRGLSIILLAVLLLVLVYAVVRMFRNRPSVENDLREAEPVRVSVDLEDEDLVATLLEEDEWVRLAREMAASGELRKAVRAWFLACVACLSRRDLLAVKKSKSNQEYRRELMRRGRRHPELVPLFSDSITVFERAWYGLHTVAIDDLSRMEHIMEGLQHGDNA